MQKKSLLFILFLVIGGVGIYYFATQGTSLKTSPSHKKLSVEEANVTLDKIYAGISGFGIPEQEVKFIKKAGGAPTYGEIKFESAQKILDYFKPTDKDVFYDLGSGVGKFVMHAYLTTDVKKSAGIELSGTRFEKSTQALYEAKKLNLFHPQRELLFHNEDIINADLSDATIIFMCATCYSDELMDKIAEKLSKISHGHEIKIATLREFKKRPGFDKIETLKLPMTWSEASPVYIYRVKQGKIKG